MYIFCIFFFTGFVLAVRQKLVRYMADILPGYSYDHISVTAGGEFNFLDKRTF